MDNLFEVLLPGMAKKWKIFVAMSPQKSLRDLTGQAGGATTKKRVFVALSGGVDSSVAAALLKERGFDVYGIHIKMWSDPDIPCNFKEDRYDAMSVAAKLDIPFQTWDFTGEYRRSVVDYMIREYAAGRTPNPDVMCNNRIKFGAFLDRALASGADYIATGHYVRLMRKSEIRNPRPTSHGRSPGGRAKSETNPKSQIQNSKLLTAKDLNKDQSYFLWTLTQEQLRHCLFPIGDYEKSEVRETARKFNLPTAQKPDSQGICFIGEIDLRQFLKNYIPERRGRVLTTAGKAVGEHSGVEFYTIGQREGIGIGGGIPYYVAEKNTSANTLVVAEGPYDEKLFRKELVATDVNWISGKEPRFPLKCAARIRYRQPLQSCIITRNTTKHNTKRHENFRGNSRYVSCSVRVIFDEAQRAVTSGQSVVFYRKNGEVLGGAIITDDYTKCR